MSRYFAFGEAISLLKQGHKVARKHWNGKGMFVMYCGVEGEDYTLDDGLKVTRRDYLYMKAADNTVVPWVASQTDILADDWYVVRNAPVKNRIASLSVEELVAELDKRDGVEVHVAPSYEVGSIHFTGPCTLIVIPGCLKRMPG